MGSEFQLGKLGTDFLAGKSQQGLPPIPPGLPQINPKTKHKIQEEASSEPKATASFSMDS